MGERRQEPSGPHPVASRLVADWLATREAIKQIDRETHPDATDALGRVWVWRWDDAYGSQYYHCGRLVEIERIDSVGVATQAMLDNQNYDLCPTCIDGRKRNITPCDPLWKCSHAVCAAMRRACDHRQCPADACQGC